MSRYLLPAFLIFYCFIASGQITFNKTYDFSNGDEGSLSIVPVEDGYILVANGSPSKNCYFLPKLL